MRWRSGRPLAATLLSASLWLAPAAARATVEPTDVGGAAEVLARSLDDPALRSVVGEILQRNPEVAAAAARARAAVLRAPQVRALPDPVVGVTAFLAPPETRVGPQRLMVAASQRLPWFGKLALAERAAVLEAVALVAEVEARRLELVTEGRRLWYELAFLDRHREITEEFRRHLEQHEQVARTRYATGVGTSQAVVKLQAEITRLDSQLLEIRDRQAGLAARIGALRDQPGEELSAEPRLPELSSFSFDRQALAGLAFARRPELAAAAARVARSEVVRQLAEKQLRPDVSLGLTYTVVERRQDEPGRLQPPVGNGDDVFGIQGRLTLPVRRGKLRAGLEQAAALRLAADEEASGPRGHGWRPIWTSWRAAFRWPGGSCVCSRMSSSSRPRRRCTRPAPAMRPALSTPWTCWTPSTCCLVPAPRWREPPPTTRSIWLGSKA